MQDVLAFILTNLPLIICLIAGVALLVVEVFVPGFGLPGISGIVLIIVGIVLTWNQYGMAAGLSVMLIALALAGISVSISIKSAAHGKISRSALILKDETPGAENEELSALLGQEGITTSVLSPVGTAEINGMRLEVISECAYLAKDVPVQVFRIEGNRIIVREKKG
ncbi:MAG: hypothetical protein IJO67_01560 [Clostridia bacterium]|nr:hypothetical protein [Clostridia bacterium]